jgi:hypothetical protein
MKIFIVRALQPALQDDKMKENKLDGTCRNNEEVKKAYKILNSVSQGKGSLGIFWSTWEENVTMAKQTMISPGDFLMFIRIQMEAGTG